MLSCFDLFLVLCWWCKQFDMVANNYISRVSYFTIERSVCVSRPDNEDLITNWLWNLWNYVYSYLTWIECYILYSSFQSCSGCQTQILNTHTYTRTKKHPHYFLSDESVGCLVTECLIWTRFKNELFWNKAIDLSWHVVESIFCNPLILSQGKIQWVKGDKIRGQV